MASLQTQRAQHPKPEVPRGVNARPQNPLSQKRVCQPLSHPPSLLPDARKAVSFGSSPARNAVLPPNLEGLLPQTANPVACNFRDLPAPAAKVDSCSAPQSPRTLAQLLARSTVAAAKGAAAAANGRLLAPQARQAYAQLGSN